MPPISACIITFNEEDNIERCLYSLDFVDEIIVVDSFSTDKTISLAQNFSKVKIFQRRFDNYVSQKNYCLSLARNSWVLFLDADEEVSPELKKQILSIGSEIWENYSGMETPRLTYYLHRWIRHGGWYPNYQIKIFNKEKGSFSGLLVHEKVSLSGKSYKLNHPLFHYSYKNISDHLQFIDKYSSLAALEKFKSGKTSGLIISIGKALYKFLYMYLVKLGFLDGRAGVIIAILGSYYNFLKYIKIYEMQVERKKENA